MSKKVLSDIEIARTAKMLPIEQVAEKLGIPDEQLNRYGRFKAKVSFDYIESLSKRRVVDSQGVVLPVEDALLLKVKGHNGELADPRIARDAAQDGEQGIAIQRLQDGGIRVGRGEVDQDFDL